MAQPLSPSEQIDIEEVPVPLQEAYTACEAIVRSHYENFPIASRFLTPARRNSLAAIYAFARRADDIADAAAPTRERLEALDQIEVALHRALDGAPSGAVFVALADSVERFRLPVEPLLDLLSAFRQDARDETFSTWDDLLAYCRGSANTIGRLVLALHEIEDADALRESDRCRRSSSRISGGTWEAIWRAGNIPPARGFAVSVSRARISRAGTARSSDAPRRRVPCDERAIRAGTSDRWRVPFGFAPAAPDHRGGRAVLRQVERSGWRAPASPDARRCSARARILLYSLLGWMPSAIASGRHTNSSLRRAASREAKRDPRGPRLSRSVDDGVDEAIDATRARGSIERWRREINLLYGGHPEESVTRALSPHVERFGIPRLYLEELVTGIEMDLTRARYGTFSDLARYCYRVASVVGLICLRIFGDNEEEGRGYAVDPASPFNSQHPSRRGVTTRAGGSISEDEAAPVRLRRGCLGAVEGNKAFYWMEIRWRARTFFASAEREAARLDRKRLVAAEIMGRVYRRLLDRIEASKFDVFRREIRVPKLERVWIAASTALGVLAAP
jgi:phytoene synthase